MQVQLILQVEDVAVKAAARYARRCFWADREELAQEARCAALKAHTTWDPAVGVPFEAYAWRACILHLRRFLWKNSSPVSESYHQLANLRGVHRAELTETLLDEGTAPDVVVEERRWDGKVRAQMWRVIEGLGPQAAQVVEQRLLYERPLQEVAEATELEPAAVERIARAARRLMSQDMDLFEMWRTK